MGQILISKFDRNVLDTITRHPDMARKNAWWLFTVFTFECLKEEYYQMLCEDDEPDTVPGYKEFSIDGMEVDDGILETLINGCADDFANAMDSGLAIRIGGKPYRVPKNENVNRDTLARSVFQFRPCKDKPGTSVISMDDIYEVRDLNVDEPDRASEMKRSRKFFHKLVYMAESPGDGWYDLTDMEAAAYT